MKHASTSELRIHPDTAAIPALTPAQYESLKAGIERNGILQPLTVDEEGRVIDGRHRLKIAAELGLEAVPVNTVAGADAALLACDLAVDHRNLTKSGRTLVLYLAHPGLAKGSEDRRKGNLIPGARQKAALDVIGITSRKHGENCDFLTIADRYRVPREYFSMLGEIEESCRGNPDLWEECKRQILEDEKGIGAVKAGVGGALVAKGKKRADTKYAQLAARTASSLAGVFREWPRIRWDDEDAHHRVRAMNGLTAAILTMPDEIRHMVAESMVHWPRADLEDIAKRVKAALAKTPTDRPKPRVV
jgi:hypothetical protein